MTFNPPIRRKIATAPRAIAPIAPIAPITPLVQNSAPLAQHDNHNETARSPHDGWEPAAPALTPASPEPDQSADVIDRRPAVQEPAPLTAVTVSEQRNDVTPFFDGPMRLTRWNTSPSSGYTMTLRLESNEIVHPFKGLSAATKAGQRLFIVASSNGHVAYEDQAILTYYGDDSRKGMTIALKLCVGMGEHPFQGYNAADDSSGAFFRVRAWLVLDDERYSERRSRSFDDLSPVAQAHIKSADSYFQSFCRYEYDLLCRVVGAHPEDVLPLAVQERFTTNTPKDFASRMIYFFCGIATRKTLGENTPEGATARAKWKAMLDLEKAYHSS